MSHEIDRLAHISGGMLEFKTQT